jgi:hypothetical protein
MRVLKWGIAIIALVNIAFFLWPDKQPSRSELTVIASPVNPDSMRLLREPTVSSEVEEVAVETRPPAPVAPECGKIGPFISAEQLDIARVQLTSLSLNFSENTEPGRSADVLRLYLVAASGADGLDSLRANLNDAGITDHFKMADEDGIYMLSLGVYSEPERANRVAKEYQGLGFDVRIREETTRLPDRFWLLVGLEGKSSQLVRTLSGMIWGTPGIGFSTDSCQI